MLSIVFMTSFTSFTNFDLDTYSSKTIGAACARLPFHKTGDRSPFSPLIKAMAFPPSIRIFVFFVALINFLHSNKILQEQQINQLYIEIGWKQGDIVSKLFEKRGYTNITVEKDSAEKDRVVSGRIVNVATANIKP